jgi:phosphoribosylamine-glycine ligase
MSEANQTTQAAPAKKNLGKRTLRALGRKKRKVKLATDKEFAKTFFAAKSKRNADKKSAFRKKKARKK